MADDIESSIRATKRQRTGDYQHESSPSVSKTAATSTLRSVSRGLSNFSRRLFSGQDVPKRKSNTHTQDYPNGDGSEGQETEEYSSEIELSRKQAQRDSKTSVSTLTFHNEEEIESYDQNLDFPKSNGPESADDADNHLLRAAIDAEIESRSDFNTKQSTNPATSNGRVRRKRVSQLPSQNTGKTSERSSAIRTQSKGATHTKTAPNKSQSSKAVQKRGKYGDNGDGIQKNDVEKTQESSQKLPVQSTATLQIQAPVQQSDLPEEQLDSSYPVSLATLVPPSSFHDVQIFDDPHIIEIKKLVLTRLTAEVKQPLPHLHEQSDSLHSILASTITMGESNSLLLLGARGSGKTLLVESVLADLVSKHADDFHIVRLNGFFQTDDKLALKEIWRQLGREMQVPENETGEVSSYADTLASLLSLLSHPEELEDPDAMSTSDSTRMAKAVIFILDEFDHFTTHPRQTLLYNLFDIAQSRKAPIAVIGCTTRMDAMDCLEKRVKSRFNHRWLHIPSLNTLESFNHAVADVVCVSERPIGDLKFTPQELLWRSKWNEVMRGFFLPSQMVRDLVKQIFYSSRSLVEVFTAMYGPIATFSIPKLPGERPFSVLAPQKIPIPQLASALIHLPIVHLCLVVAAARLDEIHNLAALNFTVAYSHYCDLIQRTRIQRSASGVIVTGGGLRLWNKDTARGAWEDLGAWEIIVPVSTAGSLSGHSGEEATGEGGGSVKMWRIDVSLHDVTWAIRQKLNGMGIGETLEKWCREV